MAAVRADTPSELRLSANFELGLIPGCLEFLFRKAGIAVTLRTYEHNQVLPHATRLASDGGVSLGGIDAFLIHPGAWLGERHLPDADRLELLRDAVAVFLNTVELAAAQG